LLERFTDSIGAVPGMNMTPENGNGPPATISPLTRSAPLELFAPPSTTCIDPVDLPPFCASVATIQVP
jgi:hypothetical protein